MRTLAELREKRWYLLLEVIYFSFLMGASLLSFIIPYLDNKPQLVADYEIKCNFGNMSTFYAVRDGGISINLTSPHDSNGELQLACGISYDMAMSLLEKELSENLAGRNVEAPRLFEMNPVYYVGTGNTMRGIGTGVLNFLVTLFVFELVRRIFYRIALGSFLPFRSKKNSASHH
jgi:hypothetical protein